MKKIHFALLACLLLSLVPITASAQENDMIRLYVLPVDVYIHPDTGREYRGPMYFQWRWNPDGLDVTKSCKDYGGIGQTTMICAADVTQAQHDWLSVQPGVFPIPENIDVNPSPQELNAFEAHLEQAYIPANWLSPSETWREGLRTVLGMFATAGKYAVLTRESWLDSGVALNTQYRNMPQYVQDALQQIATDRGYPWNDVRANWTARILLKWFADQWPGDSFRFGNLITV